MFHNDYSFVSSPVVSAWVSDVGALEPACLLAVPDLFRYPVFLACITIWPSSPHLQFPGQAHKHSLPCFENVLTQELIKKIQIWWNGGASLTLDWVIISSIWEYSEWWLYPQVGEAGTLVRMKTAEKGTYSLLTVHLAGHCHQKLSFVLERRLTV